MKKTMKTKLLINTLIKHKTLPLPYLHEKHVCKATAAKFYLLTALMAQLILFFPGISNGLTIEEAVGLALKNNAELQKQQMNLGFSQEELDDQKSQQFGKFDVVANYGHYNNPRTLTPLTPNAIIGDPGGVPTTEDLFSTGIMYEVPLFTGFAQQRSIEIAELEKEMAGVAIKLSKEQLIYNVKTLYVNILSRQAQKKAQQDHYKALKYLRNDIALQVKLGKKARVDELKAAADQENARLKVRRSEADIKIMKASLSVLLNSEINSNLENSTMKIEKLKDIKNDKDYTQLERYRSTVLDVEKSTRLEEKSDASYYPEIGLTAYYGQNYGPNDDSNDFDGDWGNEEDWMVGVNLKWTLHDFGSRKAAKSKAVIRRMQSQKDKMTTELEIQKSLKEAAIKIQLAIDSYHSAQSELALTRETERIEQIRYKKGAADMDDLLYAKARNQVALSHSIVTRYDYQSSRFFLDYLLEKGEYK